MLETWMKERREGEEKGTRKGNTTAALHRKSKCEANCVRPEPLVCPFKHGEWEWNRGTPCGWIAEFERKLRRLQSSNYIDRETSTSTFFFFCNRNKKSVERRPPGSLFQRHEKRHERMEIAKDFWKRKGLREGEIARRKEEDIKSSDWQLENFALICKEVEKKQRNQRFRELGKVTGFKENGKKQESLEIM